MVWFQRWAGLADGTVIFQWGVSAKTSVGGDGRVTMGYLLVRGQMLDPNNIINITEPKKGSSKLI
jgi:hypothetical protein